MKLFFSTLLLLALFANCTKADDNRPKGVLPSGEYVWISSSGGFFGQTITADEADYTQKVTVNEDRFTWIQDGRTVQEFKFNAVFSSTQAAQDERPAYDIYLITDADLPEQTYYTFYQIGESYFLSDAFFDGFTHEFRR